MSDSCEPPADTFSDSLRRGTRAVVLAQIAAQFISLATLAYLFRRLGPEPFGLIGMVMPALILARMIASFGLQESVVQAKTLDGESRNQAFWMAQWLGAAAMLGMLAASPLLTVLFGSKQLMVIGPALAVTLPLTSLGTVHQGVWQRQMAIDSLAKVRVVSQLIGASAACALAWAKFGVWALIAQQWLELSLLSGLLWLGSDWRPKWRGFSIHREFFRFGGWYTSASFWFYWAQNIDKYLLASLLGSTAAGRVAIGMYYQAYNLALKPVHVVTTPATSIALPALSRLSSRPERFELLVRDLLFVLFAILAPAATGMALVAPDAMWVLGGGRWLSAAPILLAFTPLVATQGVINVCGSIFAARGNARQLCWGALAQAVVLSGTCAAAYRFADKSQWTPQVCVIFMATAVGLATSFAIAAPYLLYCTRLHGLRLGFVFRPWLRVVWSCVVMAVVVNALRTLMIETSSPMLTLCASVAVGAGIYSILTYTALLNAWQRWRTGYEI